DGIALTEHDKIIRYHLDDAIVLPGAEISTRNGHLLALGIRKNIERRMSMEETIEEVHDQGGVAVIAHPYSFPHNVNFKNLRVKPDAIEVLNARAIFGSILTSFAEKMAERLSVPMVGGSDSHIPDMIGDALTIVEAESNSIDDILHAFRAGRVRPSGNCSSLRNKLKGIIHSTVKKLQ
ncbi:metal-dependent phosphoesterase, partial [Candidatus Pacearchaeota archaeon]|nr:metal-dependent phosphoesterase [Candidatus Pacearchaeota archaeon]